MTTAALVPSPALAASPALAPVPGVGPAAAPARPAPPHAPDRPKPRLRLLRPEPDPDDDEGAAAPVGSPAPVPRVPVPDDLRPTADQRRRAHQVLRLTLEVVDGRRPLAHVAPHLEPRALRYVRAACGTRPAAGPPRRLTSLHVSRPCPGAVEVAAVHRAGGRSRVVAARFEGRPDDPARWRCSTLRLL